MRLSERAMIAHLSMGVWSGRSVDPRVTEEVSESHKAELKGSGSYSKQLIGKPFLREVNAAAQIARRTHRILTLPWDDAGERILSATGYRHYTEQMRLRRIMFEAKVNEFCSGLDQYIREGKVRLGTMFDPDDYPTEAELRRKFSYDIEIKPIPEGGDFRTKLTNAATKAIVNDIEERGKERIERAMQDVFQRVYDVTAKMVERLRAFKPANEDGPADNVFRDVLVYNIRDQAELLPSLNVTGDARVDQLQRELMRDLVEHSPEVLRTDTKIRDKTADKAEALLKKVKSFMN